VASVFGRAVHGAIGEGVQGCGMSEEAARFLCVAALLAAGLLGVWAAKACRRAQERGLPGADALVWAGLAAVFLLLSQAKLARGLGWLKGLDEWLRTFAKQNDLYANRRQFQIFASVAIALVVVVLLLYGLLWIWHYIKRYRLAIGFAALAVGFGIIRFISLHEVDAWNASMPWARSVIELIATAGASAVAITRLHGLGEFVRMRSNRAYYSKFRELKHSPAAPEKKTVRGVEDAG